jgi:DNA repair exonuclease SbcCD ATPase subunit
VKIVNLQTENVKRIRAVEVKPDPEGGLVIIGGQNEQGKTSVLDSIMYALGGKSVLPPKPLREGAEHGHTKVTLDEQDLIVTRTFTKEGGGSIRVENSDGAMFRSPQKILDALVGPLSFDPVSFLGEPPKRQVEIVRALVGIDTVALDGKRMKLYEDRKAQNREVKRLEVNVNACAQYHDVPEEVISIEGITKELRAAEQMEKKHSDMKSAAGDLDAAVLSLARDQEGAESEVSDLLEKLGDLQETLGEKRRQVEALKKDVTTAQVRHTEALAEISSYAAGIPNKSVIVGRIDDAEGTNAKVRENARRAALQAELAEARAISKGSTESIEALDKQKADMIAKAKFPVKGLGFGEDGLTYKGQPFEQASGAEALQVSVAMGFALNPKCKVLLVRDGSKLDDAHLALVAKLADKHAGQVWIERVGDKDKAAVIIEDGRIRGVPEDSSGDPE